MNCGLFDGGITMKLSELTSEFLLQYREAYNTLDDVDDVYDRLQKRNEHMDVIHAALQLINDNGAKDFLGVLLLHRHFDCKPDTVFVERRYTPPRKESKHPTVLVTAPTQISDAPRRVTPYRFQIDSAGDLQPLEFTTNSAPMRGYKRLVESVDLRQSLGRLFFETQFAWLLGVAVYPRSKSIASATSVFFEETKFEELKSIVHVVDRLPADTERTIPTLWTWGPDLKVLPDGGVSGCCSAVCKSYCAGHDASGIGYCGHRKSGHIGCV
jgi:hypothetical protein